eukprot:scaffold5837_cov76-Cyclotella_meneghiniana.AAC.6
MGGIGIKWYPNYYHKKLEHGQLNSDLPGIMNSNTTMPNTASVTLTSTSRPQLAISTTLDQHQPSDSISSQQPCNYMFLLQLLAAALLFQSIYIHQASSLICHLLKISLTARKTNL